MSENSQTPIQPDPTRPKKRGRPATAASSFNQDGQKTIPPLKTRKSTNQSAFVKKSNIWMKLVGDKTIDKFPHTKLPTNRLVLLRYHTIKKEVSTTQLSASSASIYKYSEILFHELKPIWDKAFIPMMPDRTCISRIQTLLSSWTTQNCRKMKEGSKKAIAYSNMLDQLCDLAPPEETLLDVLKSTRISTWPTDYAFYKSMKCVPQVGCMTSPDKLLAQKQLRAQERRSQNIGRQAREQSRRNETLSVPSTEQFDLHEEDPQPTTSSHEDLDKTYKPTRHQLFAMHKRPDSVMLELPTCELAKATAVITARLNMSTNTALTLFGKIINLGQGDVHDFIMSRSTVWRHRIKAESEAAEGLYNTFQETHVNLQGRHYLVHWDGKKVEYASGEKEDRLCILIHVVETDHTQFIGAPQTPDGTGAAQCEAIARYSDRWNVTDGVVGMVFDTTASNTGKSRGASALYEELLEHAVMWIGCRHHVAELHVHWADK